MKHEDMYMAMVTALTFLEVNDKMLNDKSFTSTLALLLLPAIQISSLSLNTMSKSIYFTNLNNHNNNITSST